MYIGEIYGCSEAKSVLTDEIDTKIQVLALKMNLGSANRTDMIVLTEDEDGCSEPTKIMRLYERHIEACNYTTIRKTSASFQR